MIRRLTTLTRYRLHHSAPAQIGLLFGFWMTGNLVAKIARLPIPGAVLGMAALLVLLLSGHIRPDSMRRGARWLLAEMLLFFIPAVLSVLNHPELFGWLGAKVMIVILGGTISVMAVTALVVEIAYRWSLSRVDARLIARPAY